MVEYVSSGSEFIANTYTDSHQSQPRIAHFSNGSYVVVWNSIGGGTTDGDTLMAQIFAADGQPIGGQFVVETHSGGQQVNLNVAVLADDSFVVTWQTGDSAVYGASSAIAAQRFSSSGTAIGSEFGVSAPGAYATAPSITALANGSYVISWDDFYGRTVRAHVFDSNGSPIGSEVVLGSYAGSTATSHTLSATSDGGFIAAWDSPDGSGQGVRVQRFSATGADVGAEFWANTQTATHQTDPSVVVLTNGNFVVLWTSYNTTQDGNASAIVGRLFAADGTALGGEFIVNQLTAGYQVNGQGIALADGGFAVAWQTAAGAANAYDNTLAARIFDANGTALGGEFAVDSAAFTQSSYLGGLTALSDGSLRIVYSSWGADGSGDGVVVHTVVPRSSGATAPTIVSDGGGNHAAVTVDEHTTFVTTLRAIDPDGPQATTFAITGGADASLFTINAATGRLSFTYAPDFASPGDAGGDNVYDVTITASDGTLTDSQTLHVSVQSVVDTISVTSPSDVFSAENLNYTDAGFSAISSAGLPVYYQIVGGADAALLTIDPFTGQFVFANGIAPDYEAPADADFDNVYEVTVMANDGYAWVTADVHLHVTDVAELDFTSPSAVSMQENGNFVVTLSTTMAPGDVSYRVAGGDDAQSFWLDSSTGALYLMIAPDFEAPADADGDNVYVVAVEASDRLGNHVFQWLSVTITDKPEPQIISASVQNTLENHSGVMQVQATNPANAVLSYYVFGGADEARFVIDHNTGSLSFQTPPDFEAPGDADGDNIYHVTVWVGDGETYVSQDVTVIVGNENEAPILTSSNGLTIAENGVSVGVLTAEDPDGTAVTFTIVGGADAAFFSIDAATGALSFIAAPNFEVPGDAGANNVYDLVVQASDGSLATTQALVVSVYNVNETPVIISGGAGSSATYSVNENSAVVATITAGDPDGAPITYSIIGGADATRFAINSSTGVLSFISAPNFEAPSDVGANNVYDVVVQASDGTLTTSQALAVTVSNVNEAPVITSGGAGSSATYSVNENTAIVATFTSSDPDGSAPTYSIVGGSDASRFAINAATGVLNFVSAPNFEAPGDADANNVYDVVVQASDGLLTDTQTLAVTILNVVDGQTINGTSAANTLVGTNAEDTINGLGGNDTITGGLGRDVLSGGAGNDTFVFSSLSDSIAATPDMILDFGTGNDKINLAGIDARSNLAGDQAFTWIGTGAFTGVAGQLRYYQSGGDTFVTGDVNGDAIGDFVVQIDPLVTLSAGQFVL